MPRLKKSTRAARPADEAPKAPRKGRTASSKKKSGDLQDAVATADSPPIQSQIMPGVEAKAAEGSSFNAGIFEDDRFGSTSESGITSGQDRSALNPPIRGHTIPQRPAPEKPPSATESRVPMRQGVARQESGRLNELPSADSRMRQSGAADLRRGQAPLSNAESPEENQPPLPSQLPRRERIQSGFLEGFPEEIDGPQAPPNTMDRTALPVESLFRAKAGKPEDRDRGRSRNRRTRSDADAAKPQDAGEEVVGPLAKLESVPVSSETDEYFSTRDDEETIEIGEPIESDEEARQAVLDLDEPDESDMKPVDRPRRDRRRSDDAAEYDEEADEIRRAARDAAEPIEPCEMLINVADSDECRIAILRNGRLDELYVERADAISNVGNIYKGIVTNVEPSIQAAFVDFGRPAQGFLHISDLHPQYFPKGKGELEVVGKKTARRHRPPIQQCLRRGQEVIVQIIKEGIGTKGPTLTSYISVPGRFLVMMPGMEQLGVSRKIENDDERRRLRHALSELSLPKEMGFIARTAGIDRSRRDLQRDLNYLLRLWERVTRRIKAEPAPAVLYRESDLVIRTIRDVFDSHITRIVVDDETIANKIRDFLSIASPRAHDLVTFDDDPEPLFHKHGIESEIDKLHSKHVPLPCGGSLVIEQTEALVAIDVNSGRFRVPDDPEQTSYRVNQEAVDEIARQLRLRDLGGLIICDLIDMMQERHRRSIERRLTDAMHKHKERAKMLRISRFGLLEMTRQRRRPSFSSGMYKECPRCAGSGRIKAPDAVALDAIRQIRLAGHQDGVERIDVRVAPPVAELLLNRKRHQLAELERDRKLVIHIAADSELGVDEVRMTCTDRRGRELGDSAQLRAGLSVPVPQSRSRSASPPNRAPSQNRGSPPNRAGPDRGEIRRSSSGRISLARGVGGRGGGARESEHRGAALKGNAPSAQEQPPRRSGGRRRGGKRRSGRRSASGGEPSTQQD